MFEQDLEDQIVDQVPAKETIIQLTGFIQPGEEQFAPLSLDEEFKSEHERARNAIEDIDVELEGAPIRSFPDDSGVEEHIIDFVEDIKFQNYYADSSDVEVGLVPIERLIAWQSTVSTTGYEDLTTWEEDHIENLEYTLPHNDASLGMVKEIHSENQEFLGLQLTSRSPNIHVTEMASKYAEQRNALAVQFIISADPNWIKVEQFEDRLILKNGYHRVYQLLESGATWLPAVVVKNPSEKAVAGSRRNVFSVDTMLSDRPPMVTDFLTDAATEREEPAENTTIRIMAERVGVPR